MVIQTVGGVQKALESDGSDYADGSWHYLVVVKSGVKYVMARFVICMIIMLVKRFHI